MSQLYQVWKLLKTYMRGLWVQEMPKKNSLKAKPVLPLIKIVKELDKSVEFYQKNLQDFSFQQRLQKSLQEWTEPGIGLTFNICEEQLHEEIYDLLGNGALKPEIVEKVMNRLITSHEFCLVPLFRRLEDFYRCWCQGEFIDAAPTDNLPQKKMLKMQAQNIAIGLRQVDINTGLNVMILLLELHRYAQEQDSLKEQIIFYPSGQRDTDNFFTSQLLRIINYSDAIEIGNFSSVVGEFLKGGNFSGAYLGDANLTGADFSNANLRTANLGDANLSGANFSGANLKCTDLSSTNLSGVNLCDANLCGADLSSADLSGADLGRANLKGANLTSANLKDAKLCSAKLSNAILFGVNLSDANLSDVDLSHADLCRADLSGADLSRAIIKGSNLSDSILFSTNLKDAILVAADLSYAKLNGAKLNGANLKGAILLGADLTGVELNSVTLNEADLSGVILNEADLRCADLSDAILFGTDLSYANLSRANLTGSNLSGAILNGADLSHTNLSYAILSGVDLSDANLEKMTCNENLEWEGVCGLDTAVNVPDALKEKLGLS